MATLTPNLGLTQPAYGDTGWNTTLNNNAAILDNVINPWFYGVGAPGTIAGQTNGAFYLDTNSENLYKRIANVWTLIDTLGGSGGGSMPSGLPNLIVATNPSGSTAATATLRALVPADIPSMPWSSFSAPTGNLALAMGVHTTTFTAGDFGTSPVTGAIVFTDNATSTTDTSYDVSIITPPTSYHSPLYVSVDGFAQLQIASLSGASRVGTTVIGSSIAAQSLSVSPCSKVWVMDSTAAHTGLTIYQGSASASGTLLRLNCVATGTAFNFFTACAGASTTDGSNGSGTVVVSLRGDGLLSGATVPTQVSTDNSTKIASTAFVATAIAAVSGSGSYSIGLVPTGSINGTNTTFTLAYTPTAIAVYVNGWRLTATADYSTSGTTLTLVTAPATGDVLVVDIQH